MEEITLLAPAKINLSLDIVGQYQDGFHKLEMIMQSIALHDIVELKRMDSDNIYLKCSNPNLPEDERNLAYQAAKLMQRTFKQVKGLQINLKKNIPVAAGLAGGSTDAAATINGINKIYGLRLSKRRLENLAARLGSDVPFCLQGGTVFASGKGMNLKRLKDLNKTNIVLVKPPVQISTKEVYKKYDSLNINCEIPSNKLIDKINSGKNIDWEEGWANVLEPVTRSLTEEVSKVTDIFKQFAPQLVLMSGSGPTVFAIVNKIEKAKEIVAKWPRENDFVIATHTVNNFNELTGRGTPG